VAANSHIEWTEATWNPVTGCTKISAGCKNCYAERLSMRLQLMGNERYQNGFRLTLHKRRRRSAKIMEERARDFRKFNERSFPPGCPARIYSAGIPDDARLSAAHIPDTYQTQRSPAPTRSAVRLAAKRVDGRERGRCEGAFAC